MTLRKRWPSYTDIAKHWEVALCTWCHEGDHDLGWVNISRGMIHFRERQVSRAGIRRFLKLLGSIRHNHNRGQPEWQRIYEQNEFAGSAAAHMGMRFPKHLTLLDRAAADRLTRTRHDLSPKIRQWMRDRD